MCEHNACAKHSLGARLLISREGNTSRIQVNPLGSRAMFQVPIFLAECCLFSFHHTIFFHRPIPLFQLLHWYPPAGGQTSNDISFFPLPSTDCVREEAKAGEKAAAADRGSMGARGLLGRSVCLLGNALLLFSLAPFRPHLSPAIFSPSWKGLKRR